jgi:hypothetical protein
VPKFGQKPILAKLNANHPLASQMLFGLCSGWDRAYRLSPGNLVTKESRRQIPGIIVNTIPPTVYDTIDAGWALCSSSDSWFHYEIDQGVGVFISGAPFSCATLVRPLVVPAIGGTNRRIFQKRLDGAPSSAGFDMFLDAFTFLSWSFEWSDGTAEQTLRSTTVPSTGRTDLVVGTLDPVTSTARIYVNGVLENQSVLTVIPSNPTGLPIKVCGGVGPVGNAGGDNCSAMAALWQRALNPREVAFLNADPYLLWRTPEAIRYQSPALAPALAPNFFLSF